MYDEKTLRSIFSKRLRQMRHVSNMTQKQVAQLLNLDRSTYAYYETEKTCPSFDTLLRMSRLFRVSVDYLIGATDQSSISPVLKQTVPAILDGANAYSGLSENEQAFLAVYRQLDPQDQEALFKQALKQAQINP
ncbi:MAG: helix-turn-helix domain-containing protein [Oscillospiraceae bacterium]|nr:helix-turn-helix domain-containing protein [Oscillospiraceae bacterium]